MITVISGTNRPGSRTLAIARAYLELLRERTDEPVELLDLQDIDPAAFATTMYDPAHTPEALRTLHESHVLEAEKMVIFTPEYNGSYPGILKTFIDAISVHRYKENFAGKRIALIGVSSGRAGNLRGMDHLGDSIQHMGGVLYPHKIPLSGADKLLDDRGRLTDPAALQTLADQVTAFVAF
ncbi:MAG: NAD(P)H-dependent oxidoreductase [Saprospiraceae bacterium]